MSTYFTRDMPQLITDGFEKDPRTGGWFCQKCGSERIAFNGQTNELTCQQCGNSSMTRQEEVKREEPESIWEVKHEVTPPEKRHKPKRQLTIEEE